MRFSPTVLLLFAMLVFVVGCGKKEETASAQAQPKTTPKAQSKATPEVQTTAKEAKKAETATPKEAANPWDTPTRFALFIAQKNWKLSTLRAIASAQVEAGDKQQALATLKQALEAAQKIENSTKASNLSTVASAQAKAGDKQQALATLKQDVEEAPKIERERSKASALSTVASAQVQAGDKQQA
ncbi:MAG: hypothetical protein IID46_10645, partial [Planctomycetes bacterium]|nr:hypothetical protein [Planctomycetota bacterium]